MMTEILGELAEESMEDLARWLSSNTGRGEAVNAMGEWRQASNTAGLAVDLRKVQWAAVQNWKESSDDSKGCEDD